MTERLTEREQTAYDLILESQRMMADITLRDIQKAMGYASPASPHQLITSLERKGYVRRATHGRIEVVADN